jgi:hypothetical protein
MSTLLSEQDRRFFADHGYVIVRGAASAADCQAVIDTIHDYAGGAGRDRWYQPPYTKGGMLPLYHHPTLWRNRENPRLYGAAAELLEETALWVSFDRVCAKLPADPAHPEWGDSGFLHWDCDPFAARARLTLQGVLCLADTPAEAGGFRCMPGCHKPPFIEACRAAHMAAGGEGRFHPAELAGKDGWPDVTPVPARAGDYIIWDRRLPHGNGANRSQSVRYCQYILYYQPSPDSQVEPRIHDCTTPGAHGGFPADPEGFEARHFRPLQLTPLGRRIAGLDSWE